MAAIYFDSPSNDQYDEHQFFSPSDHPHHEHQFLSPNSQASSSSNSLNCHLFFNPISTNDQHGVFDRELHPSPKEDDSFISQAYDDHHVDNGGLRLSLWKRETYNHLNDQNQVKWMSSKMRVMFNMKNTNPAKLNALRSTATELKLEDRRDRKEPTTSSPMEETSSINHIPVRVCSDCNTTKTPLWLSGPQGPKSLCNACGIRQRKARKAMAAAAAMAAETRENTQNVFTGKPKLLKPTKILHKDYKRTNIGNLGKYKKRQFSKQRNTNPSSSSLSPTRKNCLEEFLVNLSKNLAFHPVFPQDEKEAAILLMAISCGYVHQ